MQSPTFRFMQGETVETSALELWVDTAKPLCSQASYTHQFIDNTPTGGREPADLERRGYHEVAG
jgi:hypothetical protein